MDSTFQPSLTFLRALGNSCRSFEIQGHRCSRGNFPENTLVGCQEAIESMAQRIEIDLVMTHDGHLVIHHDLSVNPLLCTYLDGSSIEKVDWIENLTLAEIKKIDCGGKIDPEVPDRQPITGTAIPTLKELFDFIKNSKYPRAKTIQLNLEIKTRSLSIDRKYTNHELAGRILQLVKENSFSDRVYYSSFDFDLLQEIRRLDAKAVIGILLTKKKNGITPFEPRQACVQKSFRRTIC